MGDFLVRVWENEFVNGAKLGGRLMLEEKL